MVRSTFSPLVQVWMHPIIDVLLLCINHNCYLYCCCVSIIIVICICPPGALIWLINLILFLSFELGFYFRKYYLFIYLSMCFMASYCTENTCTNEELSTLVYYRWGHQSAQVKMTKEWHWIELFTDLFELFWEQEYIFYKGTKNFNRDLHYFVSDSSPCLL